MTCLVRHVVTFIFLSIAHNFRNIVLPIVFWVFLDIFSVPTFFIKTSRYINCFFVFFFTNFLSKLYASVLQLVFSLWNQIRSQIGLNLGYHLTKLLKNTNESKFLKIYWTNLLLLLFKLLYFNIFFHADAKSEVRIVWLT